MSGFRQIRGLFRDCVRKKRRSFAEQQNRCSKSRFCSRIGKNLGEPVHESRPISFRIWREALKFLPTCPFVSRPRSLSDLGVRREGKRDRNQNLCKFEANSELFNENLRGFWPISAFPQQNHPKSDRLLGAYLYELSAVEPCP